MSNLIDYIKTRNADRRAWMEEDPRNWTGMIVEDPEFWAERNVFTIAQHERYMKVASYSDFHKEIYGYRDHLEESLTDEEVDQALNDLYHHAYQQNQWEASLEEKYNNYITNYMEQYGIDRETAVRWDDQSNWDYEFPVEEFNSANDDLYVLEEDLTVGG